MASSIARSPFAGLVGRRNRGGAIEPLLVTGPRR